MYGKLFLNTIIVSSPKMINTGFEGLTLLNFSGKQPACREGNHGQEPVCGQVQRGSAASAVIIFMSTSLHPVFNAFTFIAAIQKALKNVFSKGLAQHTGINFFYKIIISPPSKRYIIRCRNRFFDHLLYQKLRSHLTSELFRYFFGGMVSGRPSLTLK